MARCRRRDGRLFARPARISGWTVALAFPLAMMAGYAVVAQIRCCSGSGAQWAGYVAMGLLAVVAGAGLALAVAVVVETAHRLIEQIRRGWQPEGGAGR